MNIVSNNSDKDSLTFRGLKWLSAEARQTVYKSECIKKSIHSLMTHHNNVFS